MTHDNEVVVAPKINEVWMPRTFTRIITIGIPAEANEIADVPTSHRSRGSIEKNRQLIVSIKLKCADFSNAEFGSNSLSRRNCAIWVTKQDCDISSDLTKC